MSGTSTSNGASAQLWSDPSLTQQVANANDLLIALRPVTNAQGQTTGYQPYNITGANLAVSLTTIGLTALGQTLPTTAPDGGGLWLNDGQFAYAAGTGTASGAPLTPQAFAATLVAAKAVWPTTDPDASGTPYFNGGAPTVSDGAND